MRYKMSCRTSCNLPSAMLYVFPIQHGWNHQETTRGKFQTSSGEVYVVQYNVPDFRSPPSRWKTTASKMSTSMRTWPARIISLLLKPVSQINKGRSWIPLQKTGAYTFHVMLVKAPKLFETSAIYNPKSWHPPMTRWCRHVIPMQLPFHPRIMRWNTSMIQRGRNLCYRCDFHPWCAEWTI